MQSGWQRSSSGGLDAGRAAVEAMLVTPRESLRAAARARQEAEELAERRRSEYELEAAHYRQIELDGDALLVRYDRDHAAKRGEDARRREERIRWALRQPRSVIVQLPLSWQQEAYERYDQLEKEAAARRGQIEQRRYAALVNPRDAAESEIRL